MLRSKETVKENVTKDADKLRARKHFLRKNDSVSSFLFLIVFTILDEVTNSTV